MLPVNREIKLVIDASPRLKSLGQMLQISGIDLCEQLHAMGLRRAGSEDLFI